MKISRPAHPAVIVLASITLMAMLIRVIPPTEAAKQIEPNTAASPSDAAPIQFPPKSSDSKIRDTFFKLAFGSESNTAQITKWSELIKLKISGTPTPQDLATLDVVIEQLNRIVEGDKITVSKISQSDDTANLSIHFIPEPQFKAKEPGYTPKSFGFVRFAANDTGTIQYARVLVSSTGIDQATRSRLIQDLLVRALGLPEPKTPGQWIFPTPEANNNTIEESLKLLYSQKIKPGMSKQAAAVL